MNVKIMPQTPPQNDSESTAGIPNGSVGVHEYGKNGATPTPRRNASVSWWKTKVAKKPAIKPTSNLLKKLICLL
jgi:hypothetical protein